MGSSWCGPQDLGPGFQDPGPGTQDSEPGTRDPGSRDPGPGGGPRGGPRVTSTPRMGRPGRNRNVYQYLFLDQNQTLYLRISSCTRYTDFQNIDFLKTYISRFFQAKTCQGTTQNTPYSSPNDPQSIPKSTKNQPNSISDRPKLDL